MNRLSFVQHYAQESNCSVNVLSIFRQIRPNAPHALYRLLLFMLLQLFRAPAVVVSSFCFNADGENRRKRTDL